MKISGYLHRLYGIICLSVEWSTSESILILKWQHIMEVYEKLIKFHNIWEESMEQVAWSENISYGTQNLLV